MIRILNFLAHLGSYAGIGMVLFIIGLAAIIFAVYKLSRLRKAERTRSVAEFNQQFVQDTGSRISDVEAGARRADVAGRLGIR